LHICVAFADVYQHDSTLTWISFSSAFVSSIYAVTNAVSWCVVAIICITLQTLRGNAKVHERNVLLAVYREVTANAAHPARHAKPAVCIYFYMCIVGL